MASAPRHPCKRCKKILATSTYCAACQALVDKQRSGKDRKYKADTDHSKIYNARWHKASKRYRTEHPLCVMCQAEGRVTPAQCVDHIRPHKGDMILFWDERNWQSLCYRHHNVKTATEDGGWGRKKK